MMTLASMMNDLVSLSLHFDDRIYNGDFPNYPEDHKEFLSNFFLAQIDSYETGPSGVGWFMWTMKVTLHCHIIFLQRQSILLLFRLRENMKLALSGTSCISGEMESFLRVCVTSQSIAR